MREDDLFCSVFDKYVKDFEESCGDVTKFAQVETSFASLHKLLVKEDFSLPDEVLCELATLERADLEDLKKELWKS